MKQKQNVFGRWPLAVGVLAGAVSFALGGREAWAGSWELVQVSQLRGPGDQTRPSDSEIAAFRGEVAEYFSGTVTEKREEASSEGGWPRATEEKVVPPHNFADFVSWSVSTDLDPFSTEDGVAGLAAYSTGGPAEAKAEGTCRSRLRWHRDSMPGPIVDGQQTYVPDPGDNPPAHTYIKVKVYCYAVAKDAEEMFGEVKADVTPGEGATLVHETESPDEEPDPGYLNKWMMRTYRVKVETAGKELIWTPKFTFDAKAVLLGDRKDPIFGESGEVERYEWREGIAQVGLFYKPELMEPPVRITSDIEPSYKKGASQLPP